MRTVRCRSCRAGRRSRRPLPSRSLASWDTRRTSHAGFAASTGRLDRAGLDGPVRRVRPGELEMARELKWWLAAVLAACGVITVSYVPPRGMAPVAVARHRQPQPSAVRLHAQALADEWPAADPK